MKLLCQIIALTKRMASNVQGQFHCWYQKDTWIEVNHCVIDSCVRWFLLKTTFRAACNLYRAHNELVDDCFQNQRWQFVPLLKPQVWNIVMTLANFENVVKAKFMKCSKKNFFACIFCIKLSRCLKWLLRLLSNPIVTMEKLTGCSDQNWGRP